MSPAALVRLFDQYNARYWAGRLKPHRVLLEPPPRDDIPANWLGFHDTPSRTIYLRPGEVEWITRAVLFHEMIHGSGVLGHGWRFWAPLMDWVALRDPVAINCARLELASLESTTVADVLAVSREYESRRPAASRRWLKDKNFHT